MRPARPVLVVSSVLAALVLALLTPPAAQAARPASRLVVVTFNVCGHAKGCGSWTDREDAVVARIVATTADVVAVQETWGVLKRLQKRLAPYGYAKVADSGNEGLFARTSRLTPVSAPRTVTDCSWEHVTIDPSVDTRTWDRSGPHTDPSGTTWYWDGAAWSRDGEVCRDSVVQKPVKGRTTIAPKGRAGAAWAMLQVASTGRTYLFVSAHLSTGKNKVAGQRAKETKRLLAVTAADAGDRPRIFAGDFNSSIQRGRDTVGAGFDRAGFVDAFTTTDRRKGAGYNTATGWGRRPAKGGSHIDRVMLPADMVATRWEAVVAVRGGKAVRPIASDHSPVRVSVSLR